jgi:hypothetical protein
VTVTNTGTATWHADGPNRVRLGVYFGSNNTPTWSTPVSYFTLPQDVAPGQSATLTIDVAAPSKPGTYGLRERLIQDNVGWFPELLRTTASVERLSARYIVNPPTQWQAGQTRTYSITLINTGTKTWKASGANPVHLGVYFAGASDAVGDWSQEPMRFVLPHNVAPGSRVTLKITVTAPLTPGTYVLRHRMVKEYVNWFNQMVRTNVAVQ